MILEVGAWGIVTKEMEMASIVEVVTGVEKDIGFPIRRILPSAKVRMVGPFVFFDHMGPASFLQETTAGDVRPHPHIGLATVTFLFSGAMMHSDSLGSHQRIVPGDVNWMTAGRGIVHSERIPNDIRDAKVAVEGLQMWVALPKEDEACAPEFLHYPSHTIPEVVGKGYRVNVLVGAAFGQTSPVKSFSPMVYAVGQLKAGHSLLLDANYPERAVYSVSGAMVLSGTRLRAGELGVIASDEGLLLTAEEDCTFMLIGGEPVGPRYLWWNFVATDKAMIEQAKLAWGEQDTNVFPPVPNEVERIPLPV
jgi:redox-sensitive bicupin YhaK (pirin superfamily)